MAHLATSFFRPLLLTLLAVLGAAAPARSPSGQDAPDPRFLTDRTSPVELGLPSDEPAFAFAVFGDRTGGPREGVEVLRRAVDDVNLLAPDLVMTVGDLVQGYNTTAKWRVEAEEYRTAMSGLAMPWFPVAGNHDIYWRGADRPSGEHESNYEETFGPLWYAFEHKGCWFIALYSDEGDPNTGNKAFDQPAAQRMSDRQYAWLDATLARITGAEHVFVFLHHPRWLKGGYGDDWERVHARLAAAGNVSAVFAGHIHRMRYDGRRDGIEYFTLAATGAELERELPIGGFLHEYHVVNVREGRIDVVAFPVGQAIDPRALTGSVMEDLRALDDSLPGRIVARPALGESGVRGELALEIQNCSTATLEYGLSLAGLDDGWFVTPDHVHVRVEPGATTTIGVALARASTAPLLRWPTIEIEAALATPSARFPLPVRSFDLPLDLARAASPARPVIERALELDGVDDTLRIASAAIALADGPFTLECWCCAERFTARQGLLAKTESSEFGIFTSDGRPSFSVHVDGRYADCGADAPLLEPGRWHHVAGVFDGSELRLFVDGALRATRAARGARTPNDLPLVVGGDVDRNGASTSPFAGRIDEVRLSSVARYGAEGFTPQRRFESDESTRLLLHFDGTAPFAFDSSPTRAHTPFEGGARTVALAE